eukprot:TRINITY_DN24976_c0_g1_i1.p1 TRINITY_DN24976_c0_g1~~TRINITY_DN24976_c0_g1_i1.p1  ORF type:complete len:900 (+),score=161.67 TRINITY_DN24976_c0_g1_i1:352-2700(+)
MTAIATGKANESWPRVDASCLAPISMCVTMLPMCKPGALVGNPNMRNTYGKVIGTGVVATYLSVLQNPGLMTELSLHTKGCKKHDFVAAVTQLTTEVSMLQGVSTWFSVYGAMFSEIDANMNLAFSTAEALMAMPAQSPLSSPKKNVFAIVMGVLEAVGNVLLMASGLGMAKDALKGADDAAKVAKDTKATEKDTVGATKDAEKTTKEADKTTKEADKTAQEADKTTNEADDAGKTATNAEQTSADTDQAAKKADNGGKTVNKAKEVKHTAKASTAADEITTHSEADHDAKEHREMDTNGHKKEEATTADKVESVAAAIGASLVTLTGISTQSATCAASATCGKDIVPDSGASTDSAGASADNKDLLEFSMFITILHDALGKVLEALSIQEAAIGSNWAKLKQAATLAMSCPLNQVDVASLVDRAFPGMQWVAIGVLMRAKYAVYWQRTYGASDSKGLQCYYDGSSSGTATGCLNTGSAAGCYQVPSNPWDQSVYYGQLSNTGSGNCAGSGNVHQGDGNDNNCFQSTTECGATRYSWVGERDSPSDSPPGTFWDGLMDENRGVIPKFINPVFGKDYTDGWTPFVEQCSYMTKVYIPPISGSEIDYSNLWSSASSVSVPCSVFGILLDTYVFPDCGTLKALSGSGLSGQCINGMGADASGGHHGFFTGNFNQMVFVPNKKHHWASNDASDGKVGCCTPWMDSVENNGCDFIACDCFNLIEAAGFQWISQDQANNWGQNQCEGYTQTDTFTSTEMLQTSVGSDWDWLTLLTSDAEGFPVTTNLM